MVILYWNHHRTYFLHFAIAKIANIAICVGHIYVMNSMCGGLLINHGPFLWGMAMQDPQTRTDPLAMLFPQVAKCDFFHYGPSGTPQKVDALCILNMNAFSEKVFLTLCSWMCVLTVLSCIQLGWGVLLIAFGMCQSARSVRFFCYFPKTSPKMQRLVHLHILSRHANLADWFILYLIKKNVPSALFSCLLEDIDELTSKNENDA
jgi:hypothetical protein